MEGESRLEGLAWMAGRWGSRAGETWSEELWLEPRGGLMPGLHRDVHDGGRAFFEYLRIEEGPEGVVYQASPGGAPPTPFRLVEQAPGRAVFENPEHDFPRRIEYRLEPDGSLRARIQGVSQGRERSVEWVWRRIPGP